MKKAPIKSFQNLQVWQIAHKLVLMIYIVVDKFPKKEEFRLTSQIIRAVISIPSNIAEGMGRYTRKEFIKYLIVSRGSLEEVKYQIILAKDLNYIDQITFEKLISEIQLLGKKINSLISSLKSKSDEKNRSK
ncbi:MAG: four helix bundle protein [Ignavibacteria bacterium]|nr:four helix bundle protein [Ignavibacteria bacterium]